MPALDPEDQTLESLLQFHGLSHWLPLLREWCGRFEGWYTASELYEEPTADFVPVAQVMLALSHRTEPLNGSNSDFAALLAGLEFVSWYAMLDETRDRWDPLSEAFRSFSTRGQLRLWQDDRPFAPPSAICDWLLLRLNSRLEPPASGAR